MKQTTKMSLAGIVLFVVLAIIALGIYMMSYVSANNYGADTEALLEASYQDNQNVLSNYTASVKEMAQVPDKYTEDLRSVIREDVEGRYGEQGSTATFQWIKERNLPFDSSLYTRLQQTMEAGRREFANNQRRMLDIKRSYVAQQNYVWRGFFLKQAGYPKVDMDRYEIITTADTQEKFRTGTDAPLQL